MVSSEARFNKLLYRLGQNIKNERKLRKLSQADMVDFGFELRNYQRIESGKHSPSLFTLHRLAEAFDCEVANFFK